MKQEIKGFSFENSRRRDAEMIGSSSQKSTAENERRFLLATSTSQLGATGKTKSARIFLTMYGIQ